MKNLGVRILFYIFLLVSLSSCKSVKISYTEPTEVYYNYYIALQNSNLTLGAQIEDIDCYDLISKKNEYQNYKQKLGLFDFELYNGRIVSIRTASKELKVFNKLYCGQSKLELESYLSDYVKYIVGDVTIYYDVVKQVGIEIRYNKDKKVEIIRLSTMRVE